VVAKRLSWLRISCPVGVKRADAPSEKRPANE
jgi:hypothetical protein